MYLHDALKQLVAQKGEDVLESPQLVGMVSDLQAFDDAGTKHVLKVMVEKGYMTRFLACPTKGQRKAYLKLEGTNLNRFYGLDPDKISNINADISIACGIGGRFGETAVEVELPKESPSQSVASQSGVGLSAGQHMPFMGIPICGEDVDFVAGLISKGFEYKDVRVYNGEHDVYLQGTFAGVAGCEIKVVYSTVIEQVWRVDVYLPQRYSWEGLMNDYYLFKNRLGRKYTFEKYLSKEYFDPPYLKGDGNELKAVTDGKVHYELTYSTIPQGIGCVDLSVHQSCRINIAYLDYKNVDKRMYARDAVIDNDI